MERTTFSIKVSRAFAEQFRQFCDTNAFSVGKFLERKLTDVMEDFHFGARAQRVLSRGDTRRVGPKDLRRRRR